MRDYNYRRSSDKILAQEGRLFGKKIVIFLRFSSVIMNVFSIIELIWFIDPLHQKKSNSLINKCNKINKNSLMLEVVNILKLTLFSVRSWSTEVTKI